jgi:hypothetical protein
MNINNHDNDLKSLNSKNDLSFDKEKSLFSILNKPNESNTNKPDMFLNYFQYKLFDFNGENLGTSNTYDNLHKIKLFIDNKEEKSKYLNTPQSNQNLVSEEETKKYENFFGPQRSNELFI